jgi:dTDP-glucose 4,6-dehydratase
MPSRHVITGGLGFTGRVLMGALLDRGESVVLFDSAEPMEPLPPNVDFIRGDVRKAKDIAKIGIRSGDIVHHLAARQFHAAVPKRGRDAWFADVNVGGTATLLEAMQHGSAHGLVLFSTDMVYGIPRTTPVPTNHPCNPLGPYGRSKFQAENLIADARAKGLRATVFRPRLIVGPKRLGILGKLFDLIAASLPVPMIGSGANRYQMVSVFDCASAALRAIDAKLPPGPFHLGSENPPSVRQLLTRLIDETGSRSFLVPLPSFLAKTQLSILDRVGLPLLYPEQFLIADHEFILDTTETRSALGWEPTQDDASMMFEAYKTFRTSQERTG